MLLLGMAVLANGVILIVQTSLMASPRDDSSSIYAPWVSYAFVARKKSRSHFTSEALVNEHCLFFSVHCRGEHQTVGPGIGSIFCLVLEHFRLLRHAFGHIGSDI